MPRRKAHDISGGENKRRAGTNQIPICDEETGKQSVTNEAISKNEKMPASKIPKCLQNGKISLIESARLKKPATESSLNFDTNKVVSQESTLQLERIDNVQNEANVRTENNVANSKSSLDASKSLLMQCVSKSEPGRLFSSKSRESSTPRLTEYNVEQNAVFCEEQYVSNGERPSKASDNLSGVSPTLPSSMNSGNCAEGSKLNYRISTTVMETKIPMCNEMESNKNQSEAEDKKNCKLLSSVYGTAASNIERILTGLHVEETKTALQPLNTIVDTSSFTDPPSSLPKNVQNSKIKVIHTNPALNSESLSNNNNSKFKSRKDNTESLKLKLHLPEPSSSDDSNSLQLLPESNKTKHLPKVTSPQILEQHISKIISENAAIVETLDPLWSKRYLRQSSQSLDGDIKKAGVASKARRFSEDKMLLVPLERQVSKLQSALLGMLEPEKLTPPSPEIRENLIKFSGPLGLKKVDSNIEDYMEKSSIEGLLNLKQSRGHPKKKSQSFDKGKCNQHPQNPEGSIIKDLLLKTKANSKQIGEAPGEAKTLNQCKFCGLKYVDKSMMDFHKLICQKPEGSRASFVPLDTSKSKCLSDNVLLKIGSTEKLLPILDPQALSSSIEGLLKSDTTAVNNPASGMGLIQKKQLSHLSGRKCPSPKRRKISEPVLPTAKEEIVISENLSSRKSDANTGYLDDRPILPHRSKSQSIHLYGGEVQIVEGGKTKKMKIMSNLSKSISLPSTMHQNCPKSALGTSSEGASYQTVVVSIAQHAHNSGGTVTHIPLPKTPTTLSSMVVVTLPNQLNSDKRPNGNIVSSLSATSGSQLTCLSTAKPAILSNVSEIITFGSQSKRSLSKSPSPPGVQLHSSDEPLNYTKHNVVTMATLDSSTTTTSKFSSKLSSERIVLAPKNGLSERQSKSSLKFLPNIEISDETQSTLTDISQSSRQIVPNVLFTPSSPINLSSSETKTDLADSGKTETSEGQSKTFLAPARPTSLALKKKPFTMVGSTLVSPDTPRPKKNCIQLYINGHAYTYLGMKCSTRSTYCCIYRPQPMFVPQETDPKLSMYSNWQVVPAKEEPAGLTPGQTLAFYNSKQTSQTSNAVFTTAKLGEPLSFTHSSYWTYRSLERDRKLSTEEPMSLAQTTEVGCLHIDTQSSVDESFPSSNSTLTKPCSSIDSKADLNLTSSSSASENTSSLDVEASLSEIEENNSTLDDEEDDRSELTDSNTSPSKHPKRVRIFEGGFKSNEDYTYVRGRGRGKYVCEECGIRCKKPSMLKKHIRTHTDLRPYKCRHCSFAFKTKGNLTKHMKSKAHHKKCTELGIVPVPTTSDDSQIDEETLSKQEQYQKKNFGISDGEDIDEEDDDDDQDDDCDESDGLEEEEEDSENSLPPKNNPITRTPVSLTPLMESEPLENLPNEPVQCKSLAGQRENNLQGSVEQEAAHSLLHLSSFAEVREQWTDVAYDVAPVEEMEKLPLSSSSSNDACAGQEPSSAIATSGASTLSDLKSLDPAAAYMLAPEDNVGYRPRSYSAGVSFSSTKQPHTTTQEAYTSIDEDMTDAEFGGRELSTRRYSISVAREARRPRLAQCPRWGQTNAELQKWPEMDSFEQPMDLRMPRSAVTIGRERHLFQSQGPADSLLSALPSNESVQVLNSEIYINEPFAIKGMSILQPQLYTDYESSLESPTKSFTSSGNTVQEQPPLTSPVPPTHTQSYYSITKLGQEANGIRPEGDSMENQQSPEIPEYAICSPVSPSSLEESFYNQEGISTSQEELQSSASSGGLHTKFIKPSTSTSGNMEEGKCVCRICNKIFAKAGQLRIHVNIHYFERPFRCDNCGVSFRTKGHLQKHKRSVSHYNKVNMNMTFGTPSVDNPRPFKCGDCKIAFRIHGHLAKHLRSKMHIMKLECLGKLPFGMYAEMERSGISLNEIDTTDCNNSLESLQSMAQKLYQQDPRRMRWHSPTHVPAELEPSNKSQVSLPSDVVHSVPDQLSPTTLSSPSAITVPVPSTASNSASSDGDVKEEPSDLLPSQTMPQILGEGEIVSPHFSAKQNTSTSSQKTMPQSANDSESNLSLHRSDTCHLCGRMFKSAKFLQVHLYCDHSSWSLPSGDGPQNSSSTTASPRTTVIKQDLMCDLCRKHFSDQNSLQQHLLTHSQPRPFVCEICDAGFTSSASLSTHVATHQTKGSTISG